MLSCVNVLSVLSTLSCFPLLTYYCPSVVWVLQLSTCDVVSRPAAAAAAASRPVAPPTVSAPSLMEIQLEQEKQLAEERNQQQQHAKVQASHSTDDI